MRLIRKIHKWASVIVGLQFLLWLVSGLYFNLMDHTKAAGHTYKNHDHHSSSIDLTRLLEPADILQRFASSNELKIIHLLSSPYYLLTHQKGLYPQFENHYSLVDAYTGEKTVIDSTFATALAKQSYSGAAEIKNVLMLQPPLDDFPKQKNAIWRVNFADEINTSVYIEAGSGRLVGHSDDHKRFAELFFMLHFMDYGNSGSFNHLPIIMMAIAALWLSLTGLIWTIELWRRGQYKVSYLSKKQASRSFVKS